MCYVGTNIYILNCILPYVFDDALVNVLIDSHVSKCTRNKNV